MAEDSTGGTSLQEQTIALGRTLKELADNDPAGRPSDLSARVFAEWLRQAGPGSREPGYFADVADNYDVRANSHQDLWYLFGLLEGYIEVPDDEPEDETPPRRTFIGLPLAPRTERDQ